MSAVLLPDDIPSEWQPGLDALRALPGGGTALLIGGTDRGKTTFTTLAARALAKTGERVAVIDADIGQGEIGPPGTVGLAWAEPGFARLSDLKPAALFFVGAFAPQTAALELVTATAQAVRRARKEGATRLLIDTTGFITGPAARRLKVAKAQCVGPDVILHLGKGADESLPDALARATGAPILSLETPVAVGRKPTSLRTTRRLTRLSRVLQGGRTLPLPLSNVSVVGATLGTGTPLPPHLTHWTGSALHLPLVHAEQSEGILTVFTNGPVRPGWEERSGPVASHFGCRSVRALSLSGYSGAYVGLGDAQGQFLAVGRFEGWESERGEVLLSAPPPATLERIRLLQFGRVRIAPDGAFIADIRPGDL